MFLFVNDNSNSKNGKYWIGKRLKSVAGQFASKCCDCKYEWKLEAKMLEMTGCDYLAGRIDKVCSVFMPLL
jgi:hypothetical protein